MFDRLRGAFMFVGERCFEGTRTFSTQGINKASFNIFQLYARMGHQRLSFESSQEQQVLAYKDPFGAGGRTGGFRDGLAFGRWFGTGDALQSS